MEQIIDKLSEIETAPSRIMESAASEKRQMDQEQEERIAACDARVEESARRELEELRAALQSQSEAELRRLESRMADTLRRMDETYARDHGRITDEIYHNIIRK